MTIVNKIKFGSLLTLSFVALTCNNDEVTPRKYPRISTMEVSEITEVGARFNAEIIYPGNGEIVEYGFVWGQKESPIIQSNDKKIFAYDITSGRFTAEIVTTLKKNVTYYVRAYVKNEEYLVYGKSVSFISLGSGAPSISSISPIAGTLGDTVLIKGENFSYVKNNNITFFGASKSSLIASTDSTLLAYVPDDLMELNSNITVELQGNLTTSDEVFKLLPPKIGQIKPNEARSGDTLSILGVNFGNRSSQVKVLFNDSEAFIIEANRKKIEVIVPDKLTSETKIKVVVGPQEDLIDLNYLLPSLIDFNPKLISWGDTVIADVINFSDNLGSINMKLNGQEYNIISYSDNKVKFVIPNEIQEQNVIIHFNTAGFELPFNERLILKTPEIISVEPDTVNMGEIVTLNVANFHPANNFLRIKYRPKYGQPYNIIVVQPTFNSSSKIKFIVPNINDLSNRANSDAILELNARVGGSYYFSVFDLYQNIFIASPIITDFSPSQVNNVGDEVVISGKYFGDNPIAKFGNTELEIVSSSDTEIVAQIPADIFRNEKVAEYLTTNLNITRNERTGWSQNSLIIDHQTAWSWHDDSDVFFVDGGQFDQRTGYRHFKSHNDTHGYILGGKGKFTYIPENNNYRYESLKDFYEFQSYSNNWLKLPNLPMSDNSFTVHGALSHYSNIYVLVDDKHLKFDRGQNSWTELSKPGFNLGLANYFVIENRIFCAFLSSQKIYEYITDTDQWVELIDITLPAVSEANYHFTYNGKERFIISGTAYKYDPNANSWTTIGNNVSSQESIIEYEGNYYKWQGNSVLNTYNPADDSEIFEAEFPSGTGGYLFSIDSKLYFRNGTTEIVSYDINY